MSGGKGGKQSTSVDIPQWLEDAAQSNLARGQRVAEMGYTPYYGVDVAAMTPLQEAAIQNTSQAASAFGTSGGGLSPTAGMPATTTVGGLTGYSSGTGYDQSLQQLQAAAPGQYEMIRGMFYNPQTGAAPKYKF